jgi:KipI family sensor histidine kinase inhibitor
MTDAPVFLAAGETALVAEFGREINERTNARVVALDSAVRAAMGEKRSALRGIIETVPTYRSLLVSYDPLVISYKKLVRELSRLALTCAKGEARSGRVIEIPVCYGGDYGCDLADVASLAGLTEEEVIARHSAPEYLVYMIGFLPGFAYLGGLDPSIVTPRLATPRARIPAGSVGIGGEQTGVYPMASPGGWRLIGTTPVKTYDPSRAEPVLFRSGDRIKFIPVGPGEYRDIESSCLKGGN